jgi:hypothetical protein
LVLFDLATTSITRSQKPKRRHEESRKLGKQLNRFYLWAIERFDIDRDSDKVVVYHRGRKSGKEYATPPCVSHCDEGFIIGELGSTAE